MQQHVRTLGILNIIYGSLGILAGIAVFAILGGIAGLAADFGGASDAVEAAPFLGFLGVAICGLLMVLSAPSIIAGVGLLHYKPWARILTIVLSALHLLSIPFGTALGVYGLWVLLNGQTEPLFREALAYPATPTRPYAG